MPELGPCGLSEGWLLRFLGDVHWTMASDGLGRRSRDILDDRGQRLFMTFARIRWSSTRPLSAYRESDVLDGSIQMVRYGDCLFVSTPTLHSSSGGSISASLASLFTYREGASNDRLLPSVPANIEDCAIPDLKSNAEFMEPYRALRGRTLGRHVFMGEMFETGTACDEVQNYDIDGYDDFNGVKMLYCACYPTIADICASRTRFVSEEFGQPDFILRSSPIGRDIFYFGNANLGDTISCGFKLNSVGENTLSRRVDLFRLRDNAFIGQQFVVRERPFKQGFGQQN